MLNDDGVTEIGVVTRAFCWWRVKSGWCFLNKIRDFKERGQCRMVGLISLKAKGLGKTKII